MYIPLFFLINSYTTGISAEVLNNILKINMKKYICEPCGYEYDPAVGDPDGGIAPGTAFEDIPDDWVCPICGMGKEVFVEA